jgi:condensin complex subunit 2
LIDYFHDLRIIREGDSINFQKASCTLDGCVKIFSSRVDSVAVETDKLLGDLATAEIEEKKKKKKNMDDGESEATVDKEFNEDEDDEDESHSKVTIIMQTYKSLI